MAPEGDAPADVELERGASASVAKEHEFEDLQRESFAALGRSMSFVGLVGIMFGAILALAGLVALFSAMIAGGISLLVTAALQILVSVWTTSAGRSYTSIVQTRGRDVSHLMQATKQLRHIYGFQQALVVIVGALLIAVASLAMVGKLRETAFDLLRRLS